MTSYVCEGCDARSDTIMGLADVCTCSRRHQLMQIPVHRPNSAPMRAWYCPVCKEAWLHRLVKSAVTVAALGACPGDPERARR